MFANVYEHKRVLVTGHTGFKGSWLVTWLLKLGAEVIGVSKDVPTQPAMFELLELAGRIKHVTADIRNLELMRNIITSERPDFIFHLAAQAIVSTSYSNPSETMTTNIVGTMNILEILRSYTHPCVVVLITSDKCYDNVEWVWGYREDDKLGGKDIYSGSKGAAELVIKSYLYSFFQDEHPVRFAVGRAGNVIGGGDWAPNRIVADCMRAWHGGHAVEVRSPGATRPWQHVLEPLSGYLVLGQSLVEKQQLHGHAFNFGPPAEQSHTVVELLQDLSRHWGFTNAEHAYQLTDNIPFHEAGLLKLNCDKALYYLRWESNLNYIETTVFVGDWYRNFYKGNLDMYALTVSQLEIYEKIAVEHSRVWVQ